MIRDLLDNVAYEVLLEIGLVLKSRSVYEISGLEAVELDSGEICDFFDIWEAKSSQKNWFSYVNTAKKIYYSEKKTAKQVLDRLAGEDQNDWMLYEYKSKKEPTADSPVQLNEIALRRKDGTIRLSFYFL